jgi:hypothetical protein
MMTADHDDGSKILGGKYSVQEGSVVHTSLEKHTKHYFEWLGPHRWEKSRP